MRLLAPTRLLPFRVLRGKPVCPSNGRRDLSALTNRGRVGGIDAEGLPDTLRDHQVDSCASSMLSGVHRRRQLAI